MVLSGTMMPRSTPRIKQERPAPPQITWGKKRGTRGGGGGGGNRGGSSSSSQNASNNSSSRRSVPPAAYTSNKKLLLALHCDEAELEILKPKVKKKYADFANRGITTTCDELLLHVSKDDPELGEMLNGNRWRERGEVYPQGDLERDLKDVRMKLWFMAKSGWSIGARRRERRVERREGEKRREGEMRERSARGGPEAGPVVAEVEVIVLDDD